MRDSCNYRLFLAMKPDIVGFQIRSNFLSHNFYSDMFVAKLFCCSYTCTSCFSVKRVALIVFVSAIILSEVRKIDAPKYVLACFQSLKVREEL